jgi:hypothetical protein
MSQKPNKEALIDQSWNKLDVDKNNNYTELKSIKYV